MLLWQDYTDKIDKVDTRQDPPTFEPDRQIYFMAKMREFVREKSAELGRPLFAVCATFGCPVDTRVYRHVILLSAAGAGRSPAERSAEYDILAPFVKSGHTL
jgi:tRNA-2-methylthio-N6-dimethylallyladenosine synthase